MLTWLHDKDGCWHDFNINEVLSWLHGKDGRWHSVGANRVLTWLYEYWHDFDATEVLMWLDANIGATSMRVQVLMWSVVVASWKC